VSFIEVESFFFLPAAVLLHWLLPRSRLTQNCYLLLASLLFYACWDVRYLSLLVLGIGLDFGVVRFIAAQTEDSPRCLTRRRLALALSLTFSLGALAFFKYEGFFANSLNALFLKFGLTAQLPVLRLVLPLGISFFTLQRMGYVIDVYWRRLDPTQSPLDFALFACFFPQITAGPISRGSELLVQIKKPRYLTPEMLANGAAAFLLGLALKGWAAELIGTNWVDPVFAASQQFGRLSHLAAAAGYAFQVFGDFAGYSLMAIGVARLFGITLPMNFNYPFLSKSLPEFWRRWHITLNRWLFDYIFTPLSTSRGWWRGRLDLALLLTFAASGLWHGALWTFVIWGLFHGLGMVLHRNWDESYRGLCRRDRKYVRLRQTNLYAFAAWAITMAFFMTSLVPFRAPSLSVAGGFVRDFLISPGAARVHFSFECLAAAGFIVFYHCFDLPKLRRFRKSFFTMPAPIRGIAYGLIIVWLALKVPASAGTFIYQQF
jgi:alginate O-acetyltransferase complex protein AlgI